MGDWSNDDLAPGDLVEIFTVSTLRKMEIPQLGFVVECHRPPPGTLQVYDVVIMTSAGMISAPRNYLKKVSPLPVPQ